jgi:hypothetical protein
MYLQRSKRRSWRGHLHELVVKCCLVESGVSKYSGPSLVGKAVRGPSEDEEWSEDDASRKPSMLVADLLFLVSFSLRRSFKHSDHAR